MSMSVRIESAWGAISARHSSRDDGGDNQDEDGAPYPRDNHQGGFLSDSRADESKDDALWQKSKEGSDEKRTQPHVVAAEEQIDEDAQDGQVAKQKECVNNQLLV